MNKIGPVVGIGESVVLVRDATSSLQTTNAQTLTEPLVLKKSAHKNVMEKEIAASFKWPSQISKILNF